MVPVNIAALFTFEISHSFGVIMGTMKSVNPENKVFTNSILSSYPGRDSLLSIYGHLHSVGK